MVSDWRTCWDRIFCKQTIGLVLLARFHKRYRQQFCKQTIGLVLLARLHYIIRCFQANCGNNCNKEHSRSVAF